MKTVLVATDVGTICSTESYLKIWPECECVCIKSDGSIDSVRLLFVKAESVEFVNVGDKPAWRVWYLFELPCFIRKFLSCRLRVSLSGGDRGKFVIISKIIFPLTRGQQ